MTISDTFELVAAYVGQVTSLFSGSTEISHKQEVSLAEQVIAVEPPLNHISPMDLFTPAQRPTTLVVSEEQDQALVPTIMHAVVMEPSINQEEAFSSLEQILAAATSAAPVIVQVPQPAIPVIRPVLVADVPVAAEVPVISPAVAITMQEVQQPTISSSTRPVEPLQATHQLRNKKWKGKRSAAPTLVMNYEIKVSGQQKK